MISVLRMFVGIFELEHEFLEAHASLCRSNSLSLRYRVSYELRFPGIGKKTFLFLFAFSCRKYRKMPQLFNLVCIP